MRTFFEASTIGARNAFIILLGYLTWWLWQAAHVQLKDYDWLCFLGIAICVVHICRALKNTISALQLYMHQLRLRYDVSQAMPEPRAGDGQFLNEKKLETLGYFDPNRGQLAGAINGRPIFIPHTHCLVIAPPGSGKTTSKVIPALCHGHRIYDRKKGISRAASLVTTDLKWENYGMTERLRRERYKQKVIILNPNHPDTAQYEPLHLVVEAMKEGDIPKAITRAETFAHILEPEPAQDDAKGKFWRLGPRSIILYGTLLTCETYKEQASLVQVTDLISDGEHLWETLEANLKSTAFNGELAKQAQTIHAMGKYFLEHLLSARFNLQSFGAGRQVAACLGKSTFRWRDLKQESIAVYIGGKLSEQKSLKTWLKLMLECLCMELQDEKSGGNIPVDILLEEATNFGFDISDKLAALRGHGGRVTLIVQSRSELERVYGKNQAQTIWNLTDVKYFIGGSHDVELANKLSAILGNKTLHKSSYAAGGNPNDDIRESTAAEKQPLLSPHQIMNLKQQLVLVQSVGNLLCDPLTYDKVLPWPKWLDDNPIEGGKLSGRATIKLAYRNKRKGWQKVSVAGYKRSATKKTKRKTVLLRAKYLWLGFSSLYTASAFLLLNFDAVIGQAPYLLWNYTYQEHGRSKQYISCQYIGLGSEKVISFPSHCPFIRILPSDQTSSGQIFKYINQYIR